MVSESSEEPNPKLHQLSYGISVGTSATSHPTESRAPSSEESNPKLHQLSYRISVGTTAKSHPTESRTPSPAISDDPIPFTSSGNQQIQTFIRRKTSKRSHDVLDRFNSLETKETEALSTSELQRLVLLEQLHYIRQKRSMISSRPASNMLIESLSGLNDMSAPAIAAESRFVIDPESGKEYEQS